MGYSGSMSFGRSGGREEGRATVSSQLNAVVHFEMTSEHQETGSGTNLGARLPEVDFAVVLSRVIESTERDPAQLRNAIYELARIKVRTEVTHSPINPGKVRRLTLALESAIEGVETIYSKHDELRALRSLYRLIEKSEIGRSEVMIKPREPLLISDRPAAQTEDANHRAKDAPLNLERLWHWPGAAPLLRGAMVATFAVALCAVLSQFGQLRREAALASPSHPQSAPTAPTAIAQTQDAPANFSHPRFVDAGSPAVVRGDASSYRGPHDPRTVAPDEQPVKPPRPNCSTTYQVPSEGGGKVSINVVRC